jgi:monoamine oxidase
MRRPSASLFLQWLLLYPFILLASPNEADVCVIGAGMAGLGAATTLQKEGYSVIVLEAQNRHGGRVSTDYDSLSVPVERGAQWIHGVEGNPVTDMVNSLNTPHFVTDYGNANFYDVDSEMSDIAVDTFHTDYDRVMDEVADMQDSTDTDTSLAAAVEDAYVKLGYTASQQRYSNFALVDSIELEYAASSEKLSLWWFDADEELEGEDWWMPEGYGQVPDSLALDCHDLRYNQSVTSIDYSQAGRVTVTTAEQVEFGCSQVVVAVPLGILKRGNITFIPALPAALQHGVEHLEMGLLEKHFVQFNHSFWSALADFLYILDPEDSRYDLSTFVEIFNIDHYIPDTHMLCLFSSGDAAYDSEEHSEEQRLQQLMARLRQVWPSAPDPEQYVFSSWGTDPFTYGAYSSVGLGGSLADREAFRASVQDSLYFAGEHSSVCFPSTVHGAYLSGVNAANVLMGKSQDDLCSYDYDKWYETVAFMVACICIGVCLIGGILLLVFRHKVKSMMSSLDKKKSCAVMELPVAA